MKQPLNKFLNFPVTETQLATYKAAANADTRSLSSWVRLTLDKAVNELNKKKG